MYPNLDLQSLPPAFVPPPPAPAADAVGSGLRWRAGYPRKGYTLESITDLETVDAECEMCGTEIRYVHTLSHPELNDVVETGCECSAKLCEDYITPRAWETRLRNRAKRRAKWLTRTWRVSASGNDFLNVCDVNAVVFRWAPNQWKFAVDGTRSTDAYPTQDAAKLAAFDYMDPPRVRRAGSASVAIDD